MCKAYKQENDACTDFDTCAAGLGCMAGTCRRKELLSIGDECLAEFSELCPGFIAGAIGGGGDCADDGSGTDRCSVPGLLGARCDPEHDSEKDCAVFHDLICDEVSRTCQPLPGLGQDCQAHCADFLNVYCAYTNPTDPSGTCQPRVGEGRDCSKDEGTGILSACRFDLKCDSATGTCVAETRQTCP